MSTAVSLSVALALLAMLAVIAVVGLIGYRRARRRRRAAEADVEHPERDRSLRGTAVPRRTPEPEAAAESSALDARPAHDHPAAPVELRFAGESSVVGVRADTETAAEFRRLADELTHGFGTAETHEEPVEAGGSSSGAK